MDSVCLYEKYTFHLYIKQIPDGSSDEIQIDDLYLYDTMTSNSGHWTIPSGMNPSYSSNGCTVSGLSSWKSMSVNQQFTNPVSMEFEVTAYQNANQGASPLVEFNGQTHQSNDPNLFALNGTSSSIPSSERGKVVAIDKDSTHSPLMDNATGVYRIDFESSSNVKIYYNDTQIYSSTNWNVPSPYFTIGTGSSRSFTFKNVKIRTL